jgi:ATP-dependent DNA helicase DinG
VILPLNQDKQALLNEVENWFSSNGKLSDAKNFEYRPQQQQLATAIAEALSDQKHLIAEAGTGVGKSLAYLVPSLIFAKQNQRKAVVSTYTINLQEQLFHKDIPLLKKVLPFEFNVALFKGRQNYLCPRRLDRAFQYSQELFASSDLAELKMIWEWSQKAEEGTLSELPFEPSMQVWSQICSDPHVCTPKTCGRDSKCFYFKAKKLMNQADLIIVNHSLFFTYWNQADVDEESDGSGYLFNNDFVVFDEAHNLESVAARHLGLNFSSASLKFTLNKLHHAKNKKGYFSLLRLNDGEKLVKETWDAADKFFDEVAKYCENKRNSEIRVRDVDIVEDSLSGPMLRLFDYINNITTEEEESDDQDLRLELREVGMRLNDQRKQLRSFLSQEAPEFVYWIERSGMQSDRFSLIGGPVDVAEILRESMFKPNNTVVLTSATLAVGTNLSYYQSRIGGEVASTIQVDSPFDYENQMEVFIPKTLPDPKDKDRYVESLLKWIPYFVEKTNGKAFVLFTSYQQMKFVAEKLQPFFDEKEIQLLVQGAGISRQRMVEEFKRDTHSVLFGTDSFWQGVDVPGESLSNVIITKLPFSVPDHPLIEAKMQIIEERGGNSFQDYSLPEAILKFKQGVGRLIRTQQDKGIVAILDARVLTQRYGKSFMASLPKCPVTILNLP